jgi:hypothetical protein
VTPALNIQPAGKPNVYDLTANSYSAHRQPVDQLSTIWQRQLHRTPSIRDTRPWHVYVLPVGVQGAQVLLTRHPPKMAWWLLVSTV